MKFKTGQSFRAVVPFSQPESSKIHIDYVLPSNCYRDVKLIIYRVYGEHRQWWHEFMCTEKYMEFYIEQYKTIKRHKVINS